MDASSMTAFLQPVGEFFTQSVEWFGTILQVVVENPLLLVFVVGMPVGGYVIGLLSRLTRL